MDLMVVLTRSGKYNVIGTSDGVFCIQANLTRTQLEQLRDEISIALARP